MIAYILFFIVLFLIIKKPKNIGIGWSASVGAAVVYLLGIVDYKDVLKVIDIVWDPTLSFLGIIFISIILDKIGFFEWAALHIIEFTGGDGIKLFIYLLLLGALISAFFANDGAALILTPIVYQKIKHLGLSKTYMLPYIMGSGFVSDTASLPLVISNLVNILTSDYFKIGFFEYASVMVIVNFFSIIATIIFTYLFFRKDLIKKFDLEVLEDKKPCLAIKDKFIFKLTWVLAVVLPIVFFVGEYYHIPVSIIISITALVYGLATLKENVVDIKFTLKKETPWSIVIFSVGMYIVVYGLKNNGFTEILSSIILKSVEYGSLAAIFTTGLLAAFLSSIMNNLPSVLLVNLAIEGANLPISTVKILAYSNVIGCDLGPKITPIGSLATLLWLYVLDKKGIHIGWWYYFKVGIILTIPTLIFTLFGLWIVTN